MGVSLGIGGLIVDFWKNRYPVSAEAPLGLEAWQVTFMIVGFPGILLALLVYAMREPERGISEGIKSDTHPHPFRETWYELMSIIPPFSIYNLYTNSNGRSRAIGLNLGVAVFLMLLSTMLARATDDVAQWTVLGVAFYCLFSWAQSLSLRDPPTFALIFKSKALRYVNLSYPFCTTIVYSYSFWVTPYFLRSFEVGIAEAGVVLGTTLALCGGVGVAVGGIMADFLRSRRPDLHVYMAVICAIMTTIAAHILLNAKDLQTAYIANAFVQFMAVLWSGAGSSLVTELVLPRMRATSSAFYVGFSSVTGLALGPYLVGRLSDAYTAQGVVPGEALGDGLKTVLFIYLVVVFFAVLARRHYLEDYNTRVSRAEAYGEPVARS